MLKVCRICKIEKEETTDFYSSTRNISGFQNACKECRCEMNRLRSRETYTLEKGRIKYQKAKKNGGSTRSKKKYAIRHPERTKAVQTLNNAVNAGKITRKPCGVCGDIKNIHGHHPDYSKPLDVMWLCKKHHLELHRKPSPTRPIN